MVAILKQRSAEGVYYEIDSPEEYARLTRNADPQDPFIHYRVFVDSETERRYREQMGDLDDQIRAFFEFGEQGSVKLPIKETPAGNLMT